MEPTPPEFHHHRRWRLLRDVLVFQGKLLLDGLRDLVLSPISLAAALFGFVTQRDHPERYFRRVIAWGRKTEHSINLFGQYGNDSQVDQAVDRIEQQLMSGLQDGGLTRRARARIDASLDAMQDHQWRPGGENDVSGKSALDDEDDRPEKMPE